MDTKEMFKVFPKFYAFIGAYFRAMTAEHRVRNAVFILGTKEVIILSLGTILLLKHATPWYNITKALLGIPLAMLGGKIYTHYQQKKQKLVRG